MNVYRVAIYDKNGDVLKEEIVLSGYDTEYVRKYITKTVQENTVVVGVVGKATTMIV